jgi:hypothetical protein
MAGFHVLYRKTNSQIYNSISSTIILPQRCSGDLKMDTKADSDKKYREKRICPEFFFGFYKGYFGVDIGLFFDPKEEKYKTCVYSFLNTLTGTEGRYEEVDKNGKKTGRGGYWFENTLFYRREDYNPKPGETLEMSAYLDRDLLRLRVRNNEGILVGLEIVKLSPQAYTAFKTGCEIHREVVLASNLNDNKYAPSKALFSDVTFKNGILEDIHGNEIPMTSVNTSVKNQYDDYGIVPKYFMPGTNIKYNTDKTIIDIASADCNYRK